MMSSFFAFLRNDEAVTSVEYAVILAAIITAAIIGINAVGEATDAMFKDVDSEMTGHGIGP